MKILRYFLILLIVAAQVAYLVHSYGERTKEIENAPHLVLKCNQYDPRDILCGDYFAIDTDFLQLDFNSPVWGNSLYWGIDLLKGIDSSLTEADAERLKFAPREKAADDAVDLASLDCKPVAVFWKQGEDGLHTAVRVEAIGSAADAPAEGEIRTRMNVLSFHSHTDYSGETASTDRVYADISFAGMGRYARCLRFYIPDGMTPNSFEMPSDWNAKFSVELIYREDSTVIPHQLYMDGKPYLEAVQSLPRRQGHSSYNTTLYNKDVEVVPVVVSDGEEATGEEEDAQGETGQPSDEVKPEEPQSGEQTPPAEPSGEVQPPPAEQPQAVVEPQPAEQPQAEEEPQPAEPQVEPQPEQPAPAVEPQAEPQPEQPAESAPAPVEPAPAPEEDDEI